MAPAIGRTARAQEVVRVQVTPPTLTLTVGETAQAVATAFDARDNPISNVIFRWSSNSVRVATITPDAGQSVFATVTALAPGIVLITAETDGNVQAVMALQVQLGVTPAGPAVETDSVLTAGAAERITSLVARIDPFGFGTALPCRVGGFVGPNLLLTSYRSIRGADSIIVRLSSGTTVRTGVRVASYDVARDIAVLQVPAQRSGGFLVSPDTLITGRYVWVAGSPCDGSGVRREFVAARTGDRLTVDRTLEPPRIGAPLLTRTGDVAAVALAADTIAGTAVIRNLVNEARTNLGTGGQLEPGTVALAANHAYGALRLEAALGVRARITPQESWHWQGPVTIRADTTYAGPMGRYQVEFVSGGTVQSSIEAQIRAGAITPVRSDAIAPPDPAPDPGREPIPRGAEITPQGGGGGFPVIIAVLGIAAAGGGAFLLLGGDNPPGGTETPPTKGRIEVIVIPDP